MAPPTFELPSIIRGIDLDNSPFSSHFGRPIIASDDESPATVSSVRAFTVTLDADAHRFDRDIELLETLISSMRKHRGDAEQYVRKHKELIAPAYTLPVELWSRIFALVCGQCEKGIDFSQPIENMGPWPLALVCRKWASILNDTPSLWTTICIGRANEHTEGRRSQINEMMKRTIELSAANPLSIELEGGEVAGTPLLSVTSRWQDLNIRASRKEFKILDFLWSDEHNDGLDMLTRLDITVDDDDSTGSTFYGPLSYIRKYGRPSALTDLTLVVNSTPKAQTVYALEEELNKIDLPWSQLRKITIRIRDDITFSAPEVGAILTKCTSIEEVSLRGFFHRGSRHEIAFPCLRTLNLWEADSYSAFVCFQESDLPALNSLTMTAHVVHQHELDAFFARVGPGLTHLSVSFVADASSDERPSWDFISTLR